MASNEVEIRVTADTKKAEKGLKGLRGVFKDFSRQAKIAGGALTGIAVGGAMLMKSFAEAALVQQHAVSTLRSVMAKAGESFTDMEAQIMSVTAALQKKTNFGDEAQIRVLAQLVPMLGNTKDALAALPAVMEVASIQGVDFESAVRSLGPVLAGVTHKLRGTTLEFDEAAGPMERIEGIMDLLGGTAAAQADPFIQMGNAIGDVKEVIGDHFLPVIKPLVNSIQKMAENFQAMNPRAIRMVAVIGMATVAFGAIAGPILLFIGFLPFIAGGLAGIAAAALPVTLALMGIAAAVGIGIAIWRNWDKVVAFVGETSIGQFIKSILYLKDNWREVWSRMQEIFQTVVKNILGGVENVLNSIADMVNGVLRIAKKMGLMSDVAEIDKFELDFEEMARIVTNKMGDIVEVVGGKARELGTSMKEGIGGAVTDLGAMFNNVMDNMGLSVQELDTELAKVVVALEEELPEAAEAGENGLKGLGDEADKTGEKVANLQKKVKTFNELVQAGQFRSEVHKWMEGPESVIAGRRGAAPSVMAWGEGGVERRGIPSMDIFAQKDMLLSVSRIVNQSERNLRLASTLSAFGGPVIAELKFMVADIQSAANFTQEGIADFAKTVSTNAAIQAREQSIKEAWAMNPRNLNNVNIRRTLVDEPPLAHGGIVTRPTRALLGEAGPEAIIPLRGGGAGMAPTYNITISGNTVFGEMDFKRLVVKAVTDSHRRGGLPFLGK